MGDEWGNAPVEAANTWPTDTSEKPPNRYVAPKNSAVGDYERTSVEQTSKRDLGSGPPPVSSGVENSWSKGGPPTPYNREQVRYQDDNNNDRQKRSSNGGDWNDNNNDWKKRSVNNGDRNSQNQHLEEREDSFNLRKKSYQTSNNDNGTELHDARVPSQKGHDDNRNFSRPPMPTADYDHRRDPRNSRGSYNSHENDSSSRKPSRAASNDKLTNVIGSPKRPSHSVQNEFDEEEEVIHNSFSTRQAEKRLTNDDHEWRNNKPAGNQDSDVRRKLNEDNVQSARHSLESSTPRLRKVSEKEFKDAAVQTDPIDLEPIVQLVCSTDHEIGAVVRKRLFSLGFGSVSKSPVDVNVGANTSGRSVLDMGFDELNNYEKHKGDVRKDLDEPWRSPSVSRPTHSPGVTNDSHVPGKDNEQEAFNRSNNARNYPTREFESRQPLNDPVSGRDPSANSVSKENKPWENSSNIPKAKDPLRSASVKSLEPWETTDDKPRRSAIRSTSPGNVRRPPEDRDVSPNIVVKARDSSRPPSREPWRNPPEEQKKTEFWNRSDNTLRVNSSDSRGHSPNHAPRDVKQHETSFPSNVSKRENDPRWEDESRGHAPKKADPRTASPRDAHKPRDSSSSSRVAQPRVETQEVVAKKPTEKADDNAPPIKADTWDSGQGASAGSNDWLQQAAMFQKQLSGQPIAEENDKPLKKEGEPWENRRSEEPWVTTTHNDNLDNSDVNDNGTARNKNNKVGSWNKDSSIKEATSDNHWNKQNQNSFNSRVEQKEDFYNSSYGDKGDSYDDGRSSGRACYKCGKPGHISRECPELSAYPEDSSRINCYHCNKPGHRALDCPDRDGSCFRCGSPGHMAANCPSKTRKLSPFINPEPSGISPEEAWSRLMKADREKDTDDFERWFEEYAKSSPDETFQTIERKLRSQKCTGRIIAIKREGIPFTKCLVDLQGNGGKTYLAQPVLSDSSHFSRASGTLADSEDENFQWLADAGFMSDDPAPACFNCRQKGHLTKDCSVPKKESERPTHLACQHCNSLEHQTKHCDRRGGNGDRNERPYGGYNSRNGYGEKDIRSQGGQKCYNCGEEGHISRECPAPRKENTRVDRFSDSNPYANGTYGNDDRKPSYRRGYDNDGRDGGNRGGRDHTDDYSAAYDKYQNNDSFNKNRYNASRGSNNNNDDKNYNRNRGNDDYSYSKDFKDQGRDLGRREGNNNNNNRDGDLNSREDRDQSRNSGRGTANRGYDDFSRGNKEQGRGENWNNDDFSRGNKEQGRGENRNHDDFSRGNKEQGRNNDRVYASRDKSDDYDQEFGRKRDNYSSRNGQDRSRDPASQKWDTRERSTSVNRGNNGGGPTLKKETWGQKSVIAEESTGGWEQERSKMMASWNQTMPQRNEDNNSWPSEEKKNSFSNNGRFTEDRRPRGNNNEELRGRSSQTKEVFGSGNSKPRNDDLTNDSWW